MVNGLVLYVKSKLHDRVQDFNRHCCRPLLEHMIKHGRLTGGGNGNPPRPSMVDFLLQSGVDPNQRSNGSTPWRTLLKFLSCNTLTQLEVAWIDVCKLFLCYGANPGEALRERETVGGEETEIPALTIIRQAFAHLPKDVAELEAMIGQRLALQSSRTQATRKRKSAPDEPAFSQSRKRAFVAKPQTRASFPRFGPAKKRSQNVDQDCTRRLREAPLRLQANQFREQDYTTYMDRPYGRSRREFEEETYQAREILHHDWRSPNPEEPAYPNDQYQSYCRRDWRATREPYRRNQDQLHQSFGYRTTSISYREYDPHPRYPEYGSFEPPSPAQRVWNAWPDHDRSWRER